jgi:hypothetical protein
VGVEVDGVGQDRVGPVGVAVHKVGDSLQEPGERTRCVPWFQPIPGQPRVGAHPCHAVAAHERAQQRHIGLDQLTSRQRLLGQRALGRLGQALGRRRLAEEHRDLAAQDGDHRKAFDHAPLLEPPEPATGGLGASAGVGGLRQLLDQPGRPVGVTGGLGMADGLLWQVVGLEPGGRAGVEPWDELGFAPVELSCEQLAEQLVVAVPLAAAVQRHHQQVGGLRRRQHAGRPGGLQDRVAQRPAQSVRGARPGRGDGGRSLDSTSSKALIEAIQGKRLNQASDRVMPATSSSRPAAANTTVTSCVR